jgi:hypothetical protein
MVRGAFDTCQPVRWVVISTIHTPFADRKARPDFGPAGLFLYP